MTESVRLEAGFYVATTAEGFRRIVENFFGRWRIGDQYYQDDLPSGWTLGPSVADLLRDAARYRWLEENAIVEPGGSAVIHAHWDCDDSFTGFDAAIDAEIARESGK